MYLSLTDIVIYSRKEKTAQQILLFERALYEQLNSFDMVSMFLF